MSIKTRLLKRGVLGVAGILGWLATALPASAEPSIGAWLSSTVENGVPVQTDTLRFGCNDKIYAVIDLADLSDGSHQLQVDWTDPTGKTREHIDYPLHNGDTTRITVWLQLHPPKGAALFSFFNPAIGMDDFIGTWQVDINLDSKTRLNQTFEVLC
ncbi:MAG: hypothetical protein AAEJ59_04960 [Arenicellales bacterium]|nr:hypothetical protein [Arenicellales bacterium]